MNPTSVAVRAGLARGGIEFRQSLTNGQDLFGMLFWPVIMLVVLYFMRDATFESSGFGLGALALPSILGMLVAFNGMFGMSQLLATEREDGTLLRAKATPNGMVGYLVGKIVLVSGWVLVPFVVVLLPGMFMVGGVELDSAGAWFALAGVVLLGMLATLPIGAIIGSLFTSPRGVGFASMPIMGLVAVSGIFYPITAMPGWVQGLAQCFPVYWLGLGMRAAMLPDAAAAVELGGSWRWPATVAVLGAWSAVGLVVAPVLLRRMARRESGSSVAARREKAMQRAY
ncbi:ABC transporter permease [Nocardia farcinica]|uniref:ABC transporter efflux protein, DrrB family n=2 Tax=Nocardia TaxID=1817 RepID=A0A0H5P1B6_NOCFR|nr:ABC transporter permease [Nocardia farcinica]AXK87263.1 ABC transporter permease [Nocardia farcinica]MBA4858556.1 ABC transporter permease [Nocardia farcinica]MBC9819231.1 ABC transporter permease [Nocardia farcinica]MBF6140660.1 ABC transporter permease [Nocardia farcinica]MBF6232353.1 ABC transporter permease [Nocardia farcinica]